MKTILHDPFYSAIAAGIILLVVITLIAYVISKSEKMPEQLEEDNSDLSHLDFLDTERPWISGYENYN